MDPEVMKLFGVMMAIMVPVALGGSVFVLVTSFARRPGQRRGLPEAELVQLRERLEELERRESRIQEIEERLDFIERVLPGLRESGLALPPPPPPAGSTPV